MIRRARAKEAFGKPSEVPSTLLVKATPNSDSAGVLTLTSEFGQRLADPPRTNSSSKIHVFEWTKLLKIVASRRSSNGRGSMLLALLIRSRAASTNAFSYSRRVSSVNFSVAAVFLALTSFRAAVVGCHVILAVTRSGDT